MSKSQCQRKSKIPMPKGGINWTLNHWDLIWHLSFDIGIFRQLHYIKTKGQMKITEIYYSIQGESSFAGLPCVFVRTTGCNLRCVWCDTEYAFYGGEDMAVDLIIEQVKSYGCNLVEITGGEPLLQKDVPELALQLVELGFTVLIETSGERDISTLDKRVIRIMDIKCPGSGESEKNRWQNIEHLTPNDEVKFVVKDENDYRWAVAIIKKDT